MRQNYFNSWGKVYATIIDNILVKNEHEKDRLRILDKKGYAVDVSLIEEAIKAGATLLEIRETTLTGKSRIYRIPLADVQKHSRQVNLAGVQRYAFSLAWCALMSGTPEEWQVLEHSKLLETQTEHATIKEAVQGCLFAIDELQSVARFGGWL